MLAEFERIASQLGVAVRYEKGDFDGGYCILKADRILLINKRLMPGRKASVFALALHEIGLDNVFVKPVVRDFIADEVARLTKAVR